MSVEKVATVSFDATRPVLEDLFSTIGTPRVYKTDNGSPFQSYAFANFAESWGFKHQKITPYWPRANAGAESFMKKMGKVIRNAKLCGSVVKTELQKFLRAYRATPHLTTKVAPSMLLFGFSRTSGLPAIEESYTDMTEVNELHRIARENDRAAKQRMKEEFDARMRVKECQIRVGSKVLMRAIRTNKYMSNWDPNPFTVTRVNHSMLTVKRDHPFRREFARNSSCFKLCRYEYVKTMETPAQLEANQTASQSENSGDSETPPGKDQTNEKRRGAPKLTDEARLAKKTKLEEAMRNRRQSTRKK